MAELKTRITADTLAWPQATPLGTEKIKQVLVHFIDVDIMDRVRTPRIDLELPQRQKLCGL